MQNNNIANDKACILIVDADEENLKEIETFLESPNLRIIKANSAIIAQGIILEFDFALILINVILPDMDGFTLVEQMKNKAKIRNIPIILLDNNPIEEASITKGYEIGAVDYLSRPFDPLILKSKVKVFLDLNQKKKELERLLGEKNDHIIELHHLNKKIQEQQRELLEKEKLQSILEMAVTISHEFSQPLSVIIGYSDMLLSTMEKSDPYYQKLKKILENGEALAEVLKKVRSIPNYQSNTYAGFSRTADID